jgi:hypothetical protein
LLEAEQELALFNSAKGAQERALALDIIKRRVVTNPIEAEQKQLDLLKFGDDNAKKQQDLQDRVHSAQEGVADATRGVRDALRGVADAQRAVVRAEQGVEDATYRVRDAHDRVTEAAEKRKRVSLDASEQIKADIDKEQEALLQVVSSLERAVANGQVLPEDTEKWVGKLQAAADKMNGPVSAAVDNLANKVKALDLNAGAIGSGSFAPSSFLSSSFTGPRSTDEQRLFLEASGSYTGPISAADRKKLHDLNVPGFATGGFVPGPLGLPSLAIVHGGEQVLTPQQQRDRAGNGGQVVQVHQENHFHGGDTPTTADLEYANRALGWRLSQTGRSG